METGPFTVEEVEAIVEMFEAKEIAYEVLVDKDLEDEIRKEYEKELAEFKQTESQFGKRNPAKGAPALVLRTIYLEISDGDYVKCKDFLEKYGVGLPQSDGSYELGGEEPRE